jgi:hypothetical protein
VKKGTSKVRPVSYSERKKMIKPITTSKAALEHHGNLPNAAPNPHAMTNALRKSVLES